MHVVVNAAMSADGKLSSRRREQVTISGDEDFSRVDRLRADSDAIVVGVGTVLADDPRLTVKESANQERRLENGKPTNPARVVVDSNARTPPDARVVDDRAQTYLCVSDGAPVERRMDLSDQVAFITAGDDRVDLLRAFATLQQDGLEQIMVEGGGELIFSLLDDGLVDELTVFVGPQIIGGRNAPSLADGDGFVENYPELSLEHLEKLGEGVLLRWEVRY